jgi:hypothetical protein
MYEKFIFIFIFFNKIDNKKYDHEKVAILRRRKKKKNKNKIFFKREKER